MTRRQGQGGLSVFRKIFCRHIVPAFQEADIRGVPGGQLPVILQEPLIQLPWKLPRVDPLINGDVQRMPAPGALVDQPDVHFVFVGVHSELPGGDKGLLLPASAAAADDRVFRIIFIAYRISCFACEAAAITYSFFRICNSRAMQTERVWSSAIAPFALFFPGAIPGRPPQRRQKSAGCKRPSPGCAPGATAPPRRTAFRGCTRPPPGRRTQRP